MMNLFSLLLWVAGWSALLLFVAGVCHHFSRNDWRRRAEARAFDALVERHRRQA